MGNPTGNRVRRRAEILSAFAQVFANHGYAGATIHAVAAKAEMSPGLLHHYFRSKREMLEALFEDMIRMFRSRVQGFRNPLDGQGHSHARKLWQPTPLQDDVILARCWVGLFAEAVRDPELFGQARALIDHERQAILSDSPDQISEYEAQAILAYLIGALTLEAFSPRLPVLPKSSKGASELPAVE